MTRLRSGDDVFGFLRRLRTIRFERDVVDVVAAIIEDVRKRGDEALLESARKYDSPQVQALAVTPAEWDRAEVAPEDHEAILHSIRRVSSFYTHQRLALGFPGSGSEGVTWSVPPAGEGSPSNGARFETPSLGQRIAPVDACGVYVPGGRAAYPSSVVMNAVPAAVAGVRRIVVTTPARADGSLHPAVLVALREVGVDAAYRVGGAAAIAGLALGTESLPRVDKIVGPGNKYVNEAKRQLWGTVGLDGYAGPSEVAVIADGTADARYAAADLLTQIEHAPDNTAFLVSTDPAKTEEILLELERQLAGAPREGIMREAWERYGVVVDAVDLEHAVEVVKAIAPEHLSVATSEPHRVFERVRNAGCVLLGEWTPESAGDFAAGPSHTLPTSGAARFGSPVNLLDFLKVQSVIRLDEESLRQLDPTIQGYGRMEGFPAHAYGSTVRLKR